VEEERKRAEAKARIEDAGVVAGRGDAFFDLTEDTGEDTGADAQAAPVGLRNPEFKGSSGSRMRSNKALKKHASMGSMDMAKLKAQAGSAGLGLDPVTKVQMPSRTGRNDVLDVSAILWFGEILWKIPFNGKGNPERRLVTVKRATGQRGSSWPCRVVDTTGKCVASEGDNTFVHFPLTLVWYVDSIRDTICQYLCRRCAAFHPRANTSSPRLSTLSLHRYDPKKANQASAARTLVLIEGTQLVLGVNTPAFWKLANRGTKLPRVGLCCSVQAAHRSLDLAAESDASSQVFRSAMHSMLVNAGRVFRWHQDQKPALVENTSWNHDVSGGGGGGGGGGGSQTARPAVLASGRERLKTMSHENKQKLLFSATQSGVWTRTLP